MGFIFASSAQVAALHVENAGPAKKRPRVHFPPPGATRTAKHPTTVNYQPPGATLTGGREISERAAL
ncbi:MAG: hypothetical protein WBG36_02250 [Ornithinimicrobium sp.]